MKKSLMQSNLPHRSFAKRVRAWAIALAGCGALSLSSAALAITIVGSQGGPIPDNSFVGSLVRFDVTGVSGQQVSNVIVRLDMTHTWVGDLTAVLIAPGDVARLKLFGRIGLRRTGGQGQGDSSNVGGVYEFNDLGGLDVWTTAAGIPDTGNVPIGSYRTTTAGNTRTDVGGCSSYLQLAFGGLRSNQINGQWQLYVYDEATGDVGSVNASNTTLEIQTVPETPEPSLFRAGFEDNDVGGAGAPIAPIVASNIVGNCTPGINSPTGSGLTDFVMVRSNAGALEWRIKTNDLTNAGGFSLNPFLLGRNGDTVFMGDYDGDGYSDAAVWSPSTTLFSVQRSSRPFNEVPLQFKLGQTGDDPKMAADFDGDRVTDFAVFRRSTVANPVARFLIRGSTTGIVSGIQIPISASPPSFGFALRDATNDGRADFGIHFSDGDGTTFFRVFSGVNGASLGGFVDLLTNDYFVVPGQFVGSAATDVVTVYRPANLVGPLAWTPFDLSAGEAISFNYGTASDTIAQGDYDGDGIVDAALWRASPTPGQSRFFIRRSTNPLTQFEVVTGEQGDVTANGWDVH